MELYAELTRKQLKRMEDGDTMFALPSGLSLRRKKGSRACYFEAEDEFLIDQLKDHLDSLGINWQEND
jgi:hypothetical protein